MSQDKMNVEGAVEKLNRALSLQYRSVLQYTLAAGSTLGFEFAALGSQLAEIAGAELEDARRLVEKVTALGGEATSDVAAVRAVSHPREAVGWLIEAENEVLAALHAVIPETGQEPRSEALEHLMEHLILRKQNTVDFLTRVSGVGDTS